MHTTAGNHSLICITEKLYRKISFSVSGLSKRFFIATSSQGAFHSFALVNLGKNVNN